ncbi:MAG: hypothetical protein P9L94_07950 [Candidatus Hinthialibacter antarcticus]|nr:hypothetical protein [Candidatus Hinthialibacter antarcticus]
MKTAEEVIQLIQELPEGERKKVQEFVAASEDEFLEENYPPKDIAKILKAGAEAEKGINVEEFSSMAKARKSLGLG